MAGVVPGNKRRPRAVECARLIQAQEKLPRCGWESLDLTGEVERRLYI